MDKAKKDQQNRIKYFLSIDIGIKTLIRHFVSFTAKPCLSMLNHFFSVTVKNDNFLPV